MFAVSVRPTVFARGFVGLRGVCAATAGLFLGACVIPISNSSPSPSSTTPSEQVDASTSSDANGGSSASSANASGSSSTSGSTPIGTAGQWTDVTPANLDGLMSMCGDLAWVASNPNEDMLIIAVASYGLYASSDEGPFSLLGAPPDGGVHVFDNGPGQVLFDPANAGTFWEAGNHGASCGYVTTNNGQTFTDLGMFASCDSVGVDFTDPQRQTMLAGAHETAGLYKSTNGGVTWTDITSSLPSGIGATGFVYVVDSMTYLLGTYEEEGADGIFRSTNGGQTWSQVYQAGMNSQPLKAQDGTLYWMVSETAKDGFVESTDNGATWTRITSADGVVVTSEKGIVQLPNGSLATLGNSGVVMSGDMGSTWAQVGANYPYSNPTGVDYDAYRKAFYIWTYDCGQNNNTIHPGMVQAMPYDYMDQ